MHSKQCNSKLVGCLVREVQLGKLRPRHPTLPPSPLCAPLTVIALTIQIESSERMQWQIRGLGASFIVLLYLFIHSFSAPDTPQVSDSVKKVLDKYRCEKCKNHQLLHVDRPPACKRCHHFKAAHKDVRGRHRCEDMLGESSGGTIICPGLDDCPTYFKYALFLTISHCFFVCDQPPVYSLLPPLNSCRRSAHMSQVKQIKQKMRLRSSVADELLKKRQFSLSNGPVRSILLAHV